MFSIPSYWNYNFDISTSGSSASVTCTLNEHRITDQENTFAQVRNNNDIKTNNLCSYDYCDASTSVSLIEGNNDISCCFCNNGGSQCWCETKSVNYQPSQPSCVDECNGYNNCDGNVLYACGNTDSDPCLEKINKGIVVGECGVECKDNTDCSSGYVCSSYKCVYQQTEPTEYKGQVEVDW